MEENRSLEVFENAPVRKAVLQAVGIAMKVTMMTGMVCIGLGQGVPPLLGYCVGAKKVGQISERIAVFPPVCICIEHSAYDNMLYLHKPDRQRVPDRCYSI